MQQAIAVALKALREKPWPLVSSLINKTLTNLVSEKGNPLVSTTVHHGSASPV